MTEAIRSLADQWKENPKKLRTRYYKLTRPKTVENRRARRRMAEAAADLRRVLIKRVGGRAGASLADVR